MADTRTATKAAPSYGKFLTAFIRDRKTIGAVAPTSRGVAKRMARMARVRRAKAVAELGPGTGAITHELLAALPADGHLWGFEIYPPFVEQLRESVRDPRFTLLGESAETLTRVREEHVPEGFDAVISSIPFSLLGAEQTAAMLRIVAQSLRPAGVFVALQYHPRFLAPHLREAFAEVRREVYPLNIPPALLLRARGPRWAG